PNCQRAFVPAIPPARRAKAEEGLVRIRYRRSKKDSTISAIASPAILRLTADHCVWINLFRPAHRVNRSFAICPREDLILYGDEGIRTPDIVDANHALSH